MIQNWGTSEAQIRRLFRQASLFTALSIIMLTTGLVEALDYATATVINMIHDGRVAHALDGNNSHSLSSMAALGVSGGLAALAVTYFSQACMLLAGMKESADRR